MRAYIIEYRTPADKDRAIWKSKVSQEGYSSLEAAQRFILSRPGMPVKCTETYFQTERFEEYYIHDIRIL